MSALVVGGCVFPVVFCAAAAGVTEALSGKWNWEATCERGSFHGIMEFDAHGNTFTGQFLETNFWDKGVMLNGVITGSHISFDRTYGLIVQHLAADLSESLRDMSGPYESTMFGHCVLRGKKL